MELEKNQLLRFTTAGSVDDGKSTLIGRLLYDSKAIFEDQLNQISASSQKKGFDGIDLSMFTDGLKDEREQGITIDVAYRYFTSPKRKFIIADTPGHIEYTRNMVTGASTANAALILIDARKGVVEQTRRHSFIASLLQIPHIIVCINKMDLVGYSEETFQGICEEYESLLSKMTIKDVRFIPISALHGDNVVNKSSTMPWYAGAPLLSCLETLHISSDINKIDFRLPIQTVIRPKQDPYKDFRSYAGRIESGILRQNDEIELLPTGQKAVVKEIYCLDQKVEEAYAPMSVSVCLDRELDVSRGNMMVKVNNQPSLTKEIDAMICWFSNLGLQLNAKYSLRHTSNEVKALVQEILYTIDIESLNRNPEHKDLQANGIGRVKIKTAQALLTDPYSINRITGSFILVDDRTNETVAAGMII